MDGADTWSMTVSLTPASDEAFEGVVRKKALQSLTIKKNGTVLTASNIQGYYSLNPFATQGARYSDGTYAVQTSTTGSFPVAAKVGDSGGLGILTLYTNASKTGVQGTTESTWTLEADTATTAFGCANSILKNSAGAQTGTAAGCYKIDTNGNAVGMRYTPERRRENAGFQVAPETADKLHRVSAGNRKALTLGVMRVSFQ